MQAEKQTQKMSQEQYEQDKHHNIHTVTIEQLFRQLDMVGLTSHW